MFKPQSSTRLNKKLGFTLIELLVVISIISLLASVVSASLNSAREKARNAKRLADKKQVITALNLYYSTNNAWPASGGMGVPACLGPALELCWGRTTYGLGTLVSDMAPYISSFPKNNASGDLNYAYDRLLYFSAATADQFGFGPGGAPAGAYLLWAQENNLPAENCPSVYPPVKWDNYWYCYEYLGP